MTPGTRVLQATGLLTAAASRSHFSSPATRHGGSALRPRTQIMKNCSYGQGSAQRGRELAAAGRHGRSGADDGRPARGTLVSGQACPAQRRTGSSSRSSSTRRSLRPRRPGALSARRGGRRSPSLPRPAPTSSGRRTSRKCIRTASPIGQAGNSCAAAGRHVSPAPLRRRRHRLLQAVQSGDARRRDFRREGLPAALPCCARWCAISTCR